MKNTATYLDIRPEACRFFWSGNIIYDEPLFFIASPQKALAARLLFKPLEILKATDTAGTIEYTEGEDFEFDKTTGIVSLLPGTKIRFVSEAELYPEPDAPHSYPKKRDSEKYMLHSEDAFFTTLQPRFTYRHEVYDFPLPGNGYGTLPALQAKLEKREKITIAVFGDSISAGYNSTGAMGIAPRQDFQHGLFANFLREHYKTEVSLKNFSEAGKNAAWGIRNISRLLNQEESPDLIVLAWGMNDANGKVRPEKFISQIHEQMLLLKEKFPNAEFMLVSCMTANEYWKHVKTEYFNGYSEGLKTLTGNGVILADVTPVWKEIVKRKGFMSLTGNGLNHPNDFGHRIYADIMINTILNNKSGAENE